MKKQILYLIVLALLSTFVISACSDDDLDGKSVYDGLRYSEKTVVDDWIMDNYVKDYNIEVLYRWRDIETDFNYDVTPPMADTVVSFLKALRKMWLQPYINLTSEATMKPVFPKQCLLVGSASWSDANTKTLGTAEGGRKMVIYEVNDYNPRDKEILLGHCHVLHHEFGHILNQKLEYDFESFRAITPTGYSSSWGSVSDDEAKQKGFVSSYATSEPDEDFVEVLSFYLTQTPDEWEEFISTPRDLNKNDNPGKSLIQAKLGVVRTYMKESWNIDIDELRDEILWAVERITQGEFDHTEKRDKDANVNVKK